MNRYVDCGQLTAVDRVATIRPGASVLFEATLSPPPRWRGARGGDEGPSTHRGRLYARSFSRPLRESRRQGGFGAAGRLGGGAGLKQRGFRERADIIASS
jgi:hypothetical protein